MKPELELPRFLAVARRWTLLVASLSTLLCVAGWYWSPASFYPAYIVAFLFWLGITLGSLAIVMLHHLTGGGWGLPLRRPFESTFMNFFLLAVLFLPLLFALRSLYPWAQPDALKDELLQKKAGYLNVEFFQIRAAAYFMIWILLGLALNQISAGTTPEDEPRRQRHLALVSGPGLVLWALTVTFFPIDWVLSLEPHWFSTMYGVLFMGGQAVAALAFGLLVNVALTFRVGRARLLPSREREFSLFRSSWLGRSLALPRKSQGIGGEGLDDPPDTESIATEGEGNGALMTRDRMNDLGNLLLAFVMFWSYVSFMQFLIIWSGNLPEETPWYVKRMNGPWLLAAIALATLHFLLPLLLLLYRQTKRQPLWTAGVAGLLLVMRWVDLTWLVMPAFAPDGLALLLSVAATLAIGGWWLMVFGWRLRSRAALPVYELREEEQVSGMAPATGRMH